MSHTLASPETLFDAGELTRNARAYRADIDANGFRCFRTPASTNLAARLRQEAEAAAGSVQRAARDDGVLKYSAGIAELGAQAKALLTGQDLLACLHALTAERLQLTPDMSCLTMYQAGDQLGAHLDQPADKCRVTFIYYLDCASPDPDNSSTGLQLKVYGRDRQSVQAPPSRVIKTRPGAFVVGRGAEVWHARPQLQTGERVTALTACFGRA